MPSGNLFFLYQLFSIVLSLGVMGVSFYLLWRLVRAVEGVEEAIRHLAEKNDGGKEI